MGHFLGWIGEHLFDLVAAIGIISGLLFNAASFRRDSRSRRLTNLVRLTEQHRDIWKESLSNAALARVRDAEADLYTKPTTAEERQFVMLLFLHLYGWFSATRQGELDGLHGVEQDVRTFLGRPIPNEVWREQKHYFEPAFREFVDAALEDEQPL